MSEPLFKPYIITSYNGSPWVRIRDTILTFLLWLFLLYLLRDFYIFLDDIYHWLHDGSGTAKAYPKLRIFQTLTDYLSDIGILAAVFIAWPLYNRFRFANKKRRKAVDPVKTSEMANFFHVDAGRLEEWKSERSLVVTQDADGRVTNVSAG